MRMWVEIPEHQIISKDQPAFEKDPDSPKYQEKLTFREPTRRTRDLRHDASPQVLFELTKRNYLNDVIREKLQKPLLKALVPALFHPDYLEWQMAR